jgi:hypothetical protein
MCDLGAFFGGSKPEFEKVTTHSLAGGSVNGAAKVKLIADSAGISIRLFPVNISH